MRDALLVSEMKISFTKLMCSIAALIALSSSAFSLLSMGYHWARWIVFVSVSAGAWICFPSSVLAMLRKIDDDRGRRGVYAYRDDAASQFRDSWHVIYPTCTAILVIAVLTMWAGYVDAFAISEATQGTFATSDTGQSLTRGEAAETVVFCVGFSSALSLWMAYSRIDNDTSHRDAVRPRARVDVASIPSSLGSWLR
jgi:ABC-type sugar transport system permease subunit